MSLPSALSLVLSSIVRLNILLVVAKHPVDIRTESVVKRQLLVHLNVPLGHKHSPIRTASEADFGCAVRILLTSMIGEPHQVAQVHRIDSDLRVDIESIGAADLVINLHQESLQLAIVVLIDDLPGVLHNELVLL